MIKVYLTALSLFGLMLIASSCTETKGTPVDFGSACVAENDGKVLEISGYLIPRKFMYCSNRGGRMECGFDLKESPESDKVFRVDLEQGTGANTVNELASGFKPEDVKIRDKNGDEIKLSERVRLTGKTSIVPPAGNSEGVCFMQVEKIER